MADNRIPDEAPPKANLVILSVAKNPAILHYADSVQRDDLTGAKVL